MTIFNTTFSTYGGIAAPAVSPAGKGRFYFDSTALKFLWSRNGGQYVSMEDVGPSVLSFGAASVLTTTTTRYLYPNYQTANASTTVVQMRVPQTGTLKNFYLHQTGAGNGNDIVYTVRVGGVATALKVTIASTGTNGSDTVNSVAVVAGDLVDIEVTKALAIGTSPSDIVATLILAAG